MDVHRHESTTTTSAGITIAATTTVAIKRTGAASESAPSLLLLLALSPLRAWQSASVTLARHCGDSQALTHTQPLAPTQNCEPPVSAERRHSMHAASLALQYVVLVDGKK